MMRSSSDVNRNYAKEIWSNFQAKEGIETTSNEMHVITELSVMECTSLPLHALDAKLNSQ